MPLPSFPNLSQLDPNNIQSIVDALAKIQKELTWLLQNLDDLNIRSIKADTIQGGTLTLGGPDNGNGQARVLDASGNEKARIDNTGIVVNEASIRVRDNITNLESHVRPDGNMLLDHSFELVTWTGLPDPDGWSFPVDDPGVWRVSNKNNARIATGHPFDAWPQLGLFGWQAAVLRHWERCLWSQNVPLDKRAGTAGPYSLSAYFTAYEGTTVDTQAVIEIWALDSNGQRIAGSGQSSRLPIKASEKWVWKRSKLTISNLPSNTASIQVTFWCDPDTKILCDGVQLVPLDNPAIYNPESNLWMLMNGNIVAPYLHAKTLVGNNLIGSSNANVVYLGTTGPHFDTAGGSLRLKQSDGNYVILAANGNLSVYAGGTARHIFYADGSKLGGSVEINGQVLGMSPIDSPRVLIADVIPGVAVNPQGVRVDLDSRLAQAIETYWVWPNRGDVQVTARDATGFVLAGPDGATVDVLVIGIRTGYADTYFPPMETNAEE